MAVLPPDPNATLDRPQGGDIGGVRPGSPLPLGTLTRGDGVNFALFSRNATRVWLELYDRPDDAHAARVIEFTPDHHRTGDVWHGWIQGVRSGQLYAYRVDGPYRPELGHRFNRHKLLFDPYARALTRIDAWDFGRARGYAPDAPEADRSFSREDDAASKPKCVVSDSDFDWEGDQPLRRPWSETIIYETHVRGLTNHPSAGVDHPGTFAGITAKLPYLQTLGVTAVELLPIQEFNENELDGADPRTGTALKNYWGYDTVSFLAPKASYGSDNRPAAHLAEFKRMVKACHRAGIEVVLDVVFNHTAEGNERGPTLSFRGLENSVYYLLADNPRHYRNYAGTGNTINANHPVVRSFILDALRYWVLEMHVDGFRFDLASILARDEAGELMPDPPLLERIAEDPILRETKIIAEAWDAAGAYEVGSFYERRWAEWNGRFRDEVRRFWRGDTGMLGLFASRLCGSADIYERSGKGPESSINLVTCHDGFTLNDLVSYSHKHNEANGDDNRDGTNANYSANYGVEGETGDPEIEQLRTRQVKNFLLTLFVARGVPMLLGGDEFRRSQRGNNNAYCQDNAASWYDWTLTQRQAGLVRFTRLLIALRRANPILCRERFYTASEVRFFDPGGDSPDWLDPRGKQLGVSLSESEAPRLCLLFNAWTERAEFPLPVLPEAWGWRLAADTLGASPEDIFAAGGERAIDDPRRYHLGPRASAILIAVRQDGTDPLHD